MRTPKLLRGIWARIKDPAADLEVSEELTNAYFGNLEAWQASPPPPASSEESKAEKKEP